MWRKCEIRWTFFRGKTLALSLTLQFRDKVVANNFQASASIWKSILATQFTMSLIPNYPEGWINFCSVLPTGKFMRKFLKRTPIQLLWYMTSMTFDVQCYYTRFLNGNCVRKPWHQNGLFFFQEGNEVGETYMPPQRWRRKMLIRHVEVICNGMENKPVWK